MEKLKKTLIVTQKAKASLQVAKTYRTYKTIRILRNDVHEVGNTLITNVSGHIARRTYGDRFKSWARINYDQLIAAQPQVQLDEYYVKMFTRLTSVYDIVKVVIMSDDDQQGELLGYDVAELLMRLVPGVVVKRWRTNALDKASIERAKRDLDFDMPLVHSTALRHLLDLKWGVVLTVAFTNTGRGRNFSPAVLSIGRVQTAVLGLLVDREEAIRAFNKETFYVKELETQNGVFASAERFANLEQNTESVDIQLDYAVAKSSVVLPAPSPLNVTDLMKLGHRLRMDAETTMKVAEDLYLKGLITYPRTDSREVEPEVFCATIRKLVTHAEWLVAQNLTVEEALGLLEVVKLRNKKGDKTHPPVLPTGEIASTLTSAEAKLLAAIVTHTFKMLKGDAVVNRYKLSVELDGLAYYATLEQVVEKGHLSLIPDFKLPKGIRVYGKRIRKSETKAPARYNSASLIRRMEDLKIGTKSTRHTYASLLQRRNYIRRYVPTTRGLMLGQLLRKEFPMLTTHELTANIEQELRGHPEKMQFLARYEGVLSQVVKRLRDRPIQAWVRTIYKALK